MKLVDALNKLPKNEAEEKKHQSLERNERIRAAFKSLRDCGVYVDQISVNEAAQQVMTIEVGFSAQPAFPHSLIYDDQLTVAYPTLGYAPMSLDQAAANIDQMLSGGDLSVSGKKKFKP